MRDGRVTVLRPLPIHAPVQGIGEPAHLTLIVRVLIEVRRSG